MEILNGDFEQTLPFSEGKTFFGDFEQTLPFSEGKTFFYFDPPYKPLTQTASFTSYADRGFDDNDQVRLANFCKKIDGLGYDWILSNSDTKNATKDIDF